MTYPKTTLLLAGMLSLAFWTAGTPAQTTGPAGGAPAPAAGLGADAQILTEQNLTKFLRDLGYEVQEKHNLIGGATRVVTVRQGGWTYVVEVALIGNQGGLWLRSPLGNPLTKAESLPAAPLVKLLQANHLLGPCFFSYRPSDQRIALNLEIPGRLMTPAAFRFQLNFFLDDICRTRNLWDANKWPAPEPANEGGPAPATAG
jgi:hypothetical protein